jgi:hypothetical protein
MIVPVIRTRTVITAFSCLSVLALGACSDDDPEPKIAPTPSSAAPTSPSTTPASGPTEPTMPPEAEGTDAAAAEAFVRFYWATADYAQATADVEGLRSISDPGCQACQQALDFLDSVDRRDGVIRGGQTDLSAISSAPVGDDGNRRVVRFDLTSAEQTVDFPGSSDDEHYPAGTVEAEAILHASKNGWTIEYWGERP